MLKEIADLGFEYVELSHGVRVSLVSGIIRAVDEGIIKVSSVHNFCPLPVGVNVAAPNVYQPTASSSQEKSMWFRNTLKTIDFGNRVGAKAMVIHSGSLKFLMGSPEEKLLNFRQDKILGVEPDEQTQKQYDKLRDRVLAKLKGKSGKPIDRLVASYQSILEAAKEKGIKIGIENREGIEELPVDTCMKDLLERLGEPEWFRYWHDAGHAQLKHNFGLLDHETMLKENESRQLGFHLHDVNSKDRDHCEVGSGIIDWPMVKKYIRPEHLVILELSPKLAPSAIISSKEFVERNLLS
jgi:sugar phosphate isomerase/epimerase